MYVINRKTNQRYHAQEGALLIDVLNANNLFVTAPCGGKGICGKCRVVIDPVDAPVSPADLEFLSPAEIQRGIRLACAFRVSQEIGFQLIEEESLQANVLRPSTVHPFGVAIDIGTTTIEMALVDRKVEKLASLSALNRQKSFGADVISRINYTIEHPDGLERLHHVLMHQLNEMLNQLTDAYGCAPFDLQKGVVVGNTTMIHLLLKQDPRSIAFYPFTPKIKEASVQEPDVLPLQLPKIFILPCISGYIGADITANMQYFALSSAEKPVLVVDIGTNGEMALSADGRIFCCSTAAGPAFEGANISCGVGGVDGGIHSVFLEDNRIRFETIGNDEAVGLCGSGAVDLLAILLETGIVDSSGYMVEFSELESIVGMKLYRQYIREKGGEKRFYLTERVWFSAKDVREFQLAKSAVFAGMQTLLKEAGISAPHKVIVTGGLGNHIHMESALRIGLFDSAWKEAICVVNNGALMGAIACMDEQVFEETKKLEEQCNYIELSTHPGFSELYIEHMEF